MRRHEGFTLLELLIIILTVALILALAIVAVRKGRRISNEREAWSSLKTLTSRSSSR